MQRFYLVMTVLGVWWGGGGVIAEECLWLDSPNTKCVKEIICTPTGREIQIWEDCKVGEVLFTVQNEADLVSPNDCDWISIATTTVTLNQGFDAEVNNKPPEYCDIFSEILSTPQPSLIFKILDVNEFLPESLEEGGQRDVNVYENKVAGTIDQFRYIDKDYMETDRLEAELVTMEFADLFEITQAPTDFGGQHSMVFSLKTKVPLDFEERMYYQLTYNILSTDDRGKATSVEQIFLVTVQDQGDNPPYWVKNFPSVELEECPANTPVIQVEALDRDVFVNNPVRYSIIEGNEEGYFTIDVLEGNVTTTKLIDREELEAEGTSYFSLKIEALEHIDGSVAPLPNNVTQTTLVYIKDINNKIPEFDNDSYSATIAELTGSDKNINGLQIFVVDMDEGPAGFFDLTTSDPEHLEISPSTGRKNESVFLKAKWTPNTIFDYETHQSNPLTFTIFATEAENPDHNRSATVEISLTDENDNTPQFLENSFAADVPENAVEGTSVLRVQATDDDISPEYGSGSIRYELDQQCDELSVDAKSGEVTLKADGVLDFELNPEVKCTVKASDFQGNAGGNVKSQEITITVLDINDETPTIYIGNSQGTVIENSPPGSVIKSDIEASDEDTDADLSFSIDWQHSQAYLLGATVNINNVKRWFAIDLTNTLGITSNASLSVGDQVPDRETADTVVLRIKVTDKNTTQNADSASADVTIAIEDTNDVAPVFLRDYSLQNVDETHGTNGTNAEEKIIVLIETFDPDTNDNVTFGISVNDFVDIEPTEDDPTKANLITIPGIVIDRETNEFINVIVTIMDENDQESRIEISIKINDLNDNKPAMEDDICGQVKQVSEWATTGYDIIKVSAKDNDVEAPHNNIGYSLINDRQADDISRMTPFQVDKTTGQVSVLIDESREKKLDRESYESWDLYIEAYDACGGGEVGCEVLTSDNCHIQVEVLDENDNPPGNFQWTPPDNPLIVSEFLKEGEAAKNPKQEKSYEIRATDADQQGLDNTRLTYEVLSVKLKGSVDGEDLELFEARTLNNTWEGDIDYYCELRALKNLTQMKGNYVIEMIAKDHGTPPLNGTVEIELTVEDANDVTPQFVINYPENLQQPIIMKENVYSPGDYVWWSTQDKQNKTVVITVIDSDDGINNLVNASVDYDNSKVEGAPLDNPFGQIRAFSLVAITNKEYHLKVDEVIDNEMGRIYNLSLHVIDNGIIPLESWTWIQVSVSNAFEFPPYFCPGGFCTDTVSMIENDGNVETTFQKAIDKDNENVDPSDLANWNKVYYYIVGGAVDVFELVDHEDTRIRLKDTTTGLDRESNPEGYKLYIDTVDIPVQPQPIDDEVIRNYTLYVQIEIEDENDNFPSFDDDIIVASFSQTDGVDKNLITIKANDDDLADPLKYRLLNDFTWNGGPSQPDASTPFKLINANNEATLHLNFNADIEYNGYCNFTVVVNDGDPEHVAEAEFKVYAITNEFRLPVYFGNSANEIDRDSEEIRQIFRDVYGYPCIIDGIFQTGTSSSTFTRADSSVRTEVLMHFIDDKQNAPVPAEEILDLTFTQDISNQLMFKLSEIGLTLQSIGDRNVSSDPDTTTEQLLILQILLGVVSLVLGSLVFLLLTAYCLRTKSLERRVKVLSTNTFGSKSSDLNRIGMELEAVPGSNKFTGEGANPMFNMVDVDLRNDDSSSTGSGDSVLVGVEDNPEFKNYSGAKIENTGFDNPAYGRSIDDVSIPAAFSGGMRSNPLLEMDTGEDLDLTDALGDYSISLQRRSSSNCSDDDQQSDNINSNFSFGKL